MNKNRITKLLSEMTLEEKCKALAMSGLETGENIMGAIPRLGIRGIPTTDSPCGTRDYRHKDEPTRIAECETHTTTYPQMAALAATWDTEIAEKLGSAIARDARSKGIDCLLRPGINIKRSPLCGRNFEYFSENPVLAGEMSGSYIIGMQSQNVAACIKHCQQSGI